MAFFEALWDIFTSDSTYVNGALFAGLLLFAASGEWIAERAGTINISVEAMLLAGAFTSAVGYHISDSVVVGLCFGALGGMIAYGIIGLFLGAVILGLGYTIISDWLRIDDAIAVEEPASDG